jgi:hypothetical protein
MRVCFVLRRGVVVNGGTLLTFSGCDETANCTAAAQGPDGAGALMLSSAEPSGAWDEFP